MRKKVLSVLLTTAMLTSMLVGCGGTETEEKEEVKTEGEEVESSTEEAPEAEESTGPTKISMMYCDNAAYPYNEDWPVFDWIEEAANVVFDMTVIPSDDFETKKVEVLEGGSIPDIIAHTFPTASDVTSGLLLPISDYVDQMPNYQKFIAEHDLQSAVDNTRFGDGKYYALPTKSKTSAQQDVQWLIRTDIFEENEIPVPKTMDDIMAAATKLKEIYPESTPITNRFGANHIMCGFAGAFGTIAGWRIGDGMFYHHETGEWEFAPATDNWKDMLIYVNRLLETGGLDKDFATVDSDTYEDRITKGETFIMYDWTANIDRYNKKGIESDKDYNVSPIYPPTGTVGYEDQYAISWKGFNSMSYVLPSALADDPDHLADILAYLDWGYSDEAETLLSFGKEDETFTYDKNGTMVWLDPSNDYGVSHGLDNNELCIRQSSDALFGVLNAEEIALFDKMAEEGIVELTNPSSPLSPQQLNEIAEYSSSLTEYINSMMEKFIFGEESFDNWDKFVSECEKKGSIDLAKMYKEAEAARK